ncbi:MAG: hypothetical protein ACUVQY_11500, partial [Thermoproteota archaeon]
TISIDDEVEKKLRNTAKLMYGSGKGGLSKIIENALENYFATLSRNMDAGKATFKALKEGVVVAEADSLEELAQALRKKGIEPRGLRIISSRPVKPVAHSGYRMKPI